MLVDDVEVRTNILVSHESCLHNEIGTVWIAFLDKADLEIIFKSSIYFIAAQ